MFFNLLVVFINTNELEEVAAEETRKEIEAGLRTESTGLLEEQQSDVLQSKSFAINADLSDISEYDRVVRILAAKPRSSHPVRPFH